MFQHLKTVGGGCSCLNVSFIYKTLIQDIQLNSFTHIVSKLAVSLSKHCIMQLQMHAGGLSLMRDHDYVTYDRGWMQ